MPEIIAAREVHPGVVTHPELVARTSIAFIIDQTSVEGSGNRFLRTSCPYLDDVAPEELVKTVAEDTEAVSLLYSVARFVGGRQVIEQGVVSKLDLRISQAITDLE